MSYFSNSHSDEKRLIQPVIFPIFLKEILGFSTLDYIPEKHNSANKAPDFTPIDTQTNKFIFETKGTDSSKKEFEKEFATKSKFYLNQDNSLEFAIITNMRDVSVYAKSTGMGVHNLSFSIQELYRDFKKNTTRDALKGAS